MVPNAEGWWWRVRLDGDASPGIEDKVQPVRVRTLTIRQGGATVPVPGRFMWVKTADRWTDRGEECFDVTDDGRWRGPCVVPS